MSSGFLLFISEVYKSISGMINTSGTFKKAVSIDELTSHDFLVPLFGNINSIAVEPLNAQSSFSGSGHKKIILHYKNKAPVTLVLKTISPSEDMTIWRSGNFPNREASLVACEELKGIWNIIQSPYVGYCSEDEDSALLMHDLSPYLFPDVREPISMQQEDLILQTLARLHAKYWQQPLECESWLLKQEIFFSFLGPNAYEEEKLRGRGHPILDATQNGWKLVEQNLPAKLSSFILDPPIEEFTAGLPKTLIHGDSKLGNFALLPGEKLSAFDWTVVSYASPAIEIGWYIAVNASRLSRTKEAVLHLYRESLQRELGKTFDEDTWNQMTNLAVLAGARILLWNKALNVQKGIAGAKEEWEWWINRLP